MRAFTLKAIGVLGATCLYTVGSGTLRAQMIEVSPTRVMSDETAAIRATGLRPNQRVTIQASLVDGSERRWTSQAEFLADPHGVVDVSHQSPVKGSYDEVSAMGLVWSMRPEEKHVERYVSPRDLGTQIIEFRLIEDGKQLSSVQLEQRTVADGVRQIKVEGQLHGVFFIPGTSGRHPGVLVVGGSEGGVPTQKAAWLASHGFAALALAYFRYENLPTELARIPLEYFGQALAWIRQRPEILPDHIAVVGHSRGGELALQLGSMYPHITAVVAYVPANVRYAACCGRNQLPAWTWQGQPLAYYVPHNRSFPNPMETREAAIAVEHTNGSILLISGDDDGIWPSSLMTNALANRLKSAHFPYPIERWNYSHAGHHAGRPEIVPEWNGGSMNLGGTAKGDAESSLDAIPRVLEFLRANLAAGSSAQ